MAWNPNEEGSYAWLTKEASSNGGVEQFIETIESNGIEQGKVLGFIKAAKVIIPVAGTLGFVLGAVGKSVYDKYKQNSEHRKELQRKSDKAKATLINELKPEESTVHENDSANTNND